jgi:hypothetical protein
MMSITIKTHDTIHTEGAKEEGEAAAEKQREKKGWKREWDDFQMQRHLHACNKGKFHASQSGFEQLTYQYEHKDGQVDSGE